MQFYDEGHFDEGLSWISPSIAMIDFIAEALRQFGLTKISSIGCGGGLLEWMITTIAGESFKNNLTLVSLKHCLLFADYFELVNFEGPF